MDLNEQIIRELEDCGLNDKQVMSIGKMLYQICYDLNINHVLINEMSEGIEVVLLDGCELEQLIAIIYYDELELLNKPQSSDFVSHFTNELKFRFS